MSLEASGVQGEGRRESENNHPLSSDSSLLSCLTPPPFDEIFCALGAERSISILQIQARDRRAREGSILLGERLRSLSLSVVLSVLQSRREHHLLAQK